LMRCAIVGQVLSAPRYSTGTDASNRCYQR
jgi:hypothetical protein